MFLPIAWALTVTVGGPALALLVIFAMISATLLDDVEDYPRWMFFVNCTTAIILCVIALFWIVVGLVVGLGYVWQWALETGAR